MAAMTERVWFSHAIEGVFVRGLGKRLTPELRAKIKTAGIDLSKSQPWPVDLVRKASRAILPDLYPRLPEDEGFRQLGISFLQGYAETLVGGAMVAMMRVIGPKRSLERMQKNFRTGGNYLETRFKELGPKHIELWISDVSEMPWLYVGMIEEGGRMTGTKNLRVSLVDQTPPSITMHVTWE